MCCVHQEPHVLILPYKSFFQPFLGTSMNFSGREQKERQSIEEKLKTFVLFGQMKKGKKKAKYKNELNE